VNTPQRALNYFIHRCFIISLCGEEPHHVSAPQVFSGKTEPNYALTYQSSDIFPHTLSQKRWMISLLIMKRKSIHPMEGKVSFHRMNAFYISLLTMKPAIAFGTVYHKYHIWNHFLLTKMCMPRQVKQPDLKNQENHTMNHHHYHQEYIHKSLCNQKHHIGDKPSIEDHLLQ
jgi:hypothetical protein